MRRNSFVIFFTTVILSCNLSRCLQEESFVKARIQILYPNNHEPTYFASMPLQVFQYSVSKTYADSTKDSEEINPSKIFYEPLATVKPQKNKTEIRRKRSADATLFMDYILIKQVYTTLTAFERMNIITINGTLSESVINLLDEYAVNTDFYLLLTKKIEDEIGACDFLATPKWWRIKITVPGSEDKVRLLDLMLETLLRHYYKWLCENHYIISKKSPNELAAIGLEITKSEDFYRILTEGESQITDFEKNLSRHNWWLQEGDIDEENGELVWTIQ